MGFMQLARDSLTSLVANLGTDRDKAASLYYGTPLIDDQQLLNAYRGAWLPRKIVDIPALDSCRAWRAWQADNRQIEVIEAEEKRLNVRGKVLEARTKARLWGGAAIYIGTGDKNPAEPFDPERIRKGGIKFLTVLTRKVLTAGEIETNPESEWYGKPNGYRLANSFQQLEIHPSRLVVFQGNSNPDEATAAHRGWGDSVLTSVIQAIHQADGTAANIASLVFEAKVNVIRIPDFMTSLGDASYRSKLIERYTLAATSKGINGDLLLDKEEEFEQKTASFATLPEVLMSFLQLVSGAADIPATRLLGMSPAGMNATGESDLRNYYDRISAGQQIDMTPAMFRLDEAIIRSATGTRDASIFYIWKPLWQLSEKEKAEIGKIKSEAAEKDAAAGLIPIDALAKARQNQLIEDGFYPGLEGALEESSLVAEEEGDAAPEEMGALDPPANAAVKPVAATNDATPRTLYVRRDVINKADIVRWAKSQGFADIVPDLHVTIAFSKTPVDWFSVGTSWSEKIDIAPGGPRQMDRLGQDGEYIVLLITANELIWRNREIREAGASWGWPDYQPHISIQVGGDVDLSKVVPYQGKIVLGPEVFEELKEDREAAVAGDAERLTEEELKAIAEATKWLEKAIARHERHMNGSEATSEESQMTMMNEMRKALEALDLPSTDDAKKPARKTMKM